MTVLLLLGAIACLTCSHICKAKRWQLFVSVYENIPDTLLISSLSAGYLINFFVPFHIGDLCCAWLAGRKMHNGVGHSLATVIVDRMLDVLSVAVIFIITSFFVPDEAIGLAAKTYIILLIVVAVLLIPILCLNRQIKQSALYVCSVFNDRIKFRLLFFLWSLISSFKDLFRKVNKGKLFLYTLTTWVGYLVAYALVAGALSSVGSKTTLSDMLLTMFRVQSVVQSTFGTTSGVLSATAEILLIIFVLAPLPLLLIGSLLLSRRQGQPSTAESPVLLLPQFKPDEQLQFLQNYFEGRDRKSIHEYLSMNNDVGILRDYSAGSDATTMLCVREDQTIFRKYAFGSAVEKLAQQAQWIKDYAETLPLPEISLEKKGVDSYCYDMRYTSEGITLFQYIYSHPIEQSWSILQQILTDLRDRLHTPHGPAVSRQELEVYIDSKVTDNLRQITQSRTLRTLTEPDTLIINGRSCKNLPRLKFMLEKEHLLSIFSGDVTSAVHGDLTLENIICYTTGTHEVPYYLIDPNPGNPVCTPTLDYGKLLQSLHGKYEFLGQHPTARVSGNTIDFLLPDSSQYSKVYQLLREWMHANLSRDDLRRVYYHEIVHWLRLMPYRLRRSEGTADQYYAALILIMNDVYSLFEEENV